MLILIEDELLKLVAQDEILEIRRSCIEALGFSSRPGIEEIINTAYLSNDEKLRQSALIAMGRSANERWDEAILKELGISISAAYEMFYRQIIAHQGIPFDLHIPNKDTLQAMQEARDGKGERYDSVEKMFEDLNV